MRSCCVSKMHIGLPMVIMAWAAACSVPVAIQPPLGPASRAALWSFSGLSESTRNTLGHQDRSLRTLSSDLLRDMRCSDSIARTWTTCRQMVKVARASTASRRPVGTLAGAAKLCISHPQPRSFTPTRHTSAQTAYHPASSAPSHFSYFTWH